MMLTYGFKYCGRALLSDRVCRGCTPLHGAAVNNNDIACHILLKSGADVNAKDNQ